MYLLSTRIWCEEIQFPLCLLLPTANCKQYLRSSHCNLPILWKSQWCYYIRYTLLCHATEQKEHHKLSSPAKMIARQMSHSFRMPMRFSAINESKYYRKYVAARHRAYTLHCTRSFLHHSFNIYRNNHLTDGIYECVTDDAFDFAVLCLAKLSLSDQSIMCGAPKMNVKKGNNECTCTSHLITFIIIQCHLPHLYLSRSTASATPRRCCSIPIHPSTRAWYCVCFLSWSSIICFTIALALHGMAMRWVLFPTVSLCDGFHSSQPQIEYREHILHIYVESRTDKWHIAYNS